MMEKEKKPQTKRASSPKLLSATESGERKKPAVGKQASPVRINQNGAEPRKTTAPKRRSKSKLAQMIASHDEIAKLAHRYWIERGHQHGHHEEDWLRAERELLGKAS